MDVKESQESNKMQRNRQALGAISTNSQLVKQPQLLTAGGPFKQAVKQSAQDENGLKTSKASSENLEFDIYQEEVKVTEAKPRQQQQPVVDIKLKETSHLDYLESVAVFAKSSDVKKEEDLAELFEEEEEDDYEVEDEEEEEGISRLNLLDDGRMEQDLVSMMDSSTMSPMEVLDDTIRFNSYLSEAPDEAEAELDEEEKRKLMLEEQDNLIQSCLEYKDDILAYMREQELENRPKVNYMKKQQDINSSMRCILVDWLVEVCEEYRLNQETLYLTVNYTERFLSQMSVLRGKLQLVGTASMYIAAKYEEVAPPDITEFVYITDDTYTKKQVLRMEHLLLKVLDFKMSSPTANWFLSHYLRYSSIKDF